MNSITWTTKPLSLDSTPVRGEYDLPVRSIYFCPSLRCFVGSRVAMVLLSREGLKIMAWSWSHTAEAYQNARDSFLELPPSTLRVILAEWVAAERDEYGEYDFNLRKYRKAIRENYRLERRLGPHILESLAEDCWNRIEELATCDNGGWNCWVCPFGCHTVPFNRAETEQYTLS
jgi:hypothetical protein